MFELFWSVMSRSSCVNELRSFDHGPSHWARVAGNGRYLGERTADCDLYVVELFALFHDSMRESEWSDPQHGARGADLALDLGVDAILGAKRFDKFTIACRDHDAGETTSDPTIGVCWDADRMDLGRVGIQPNPTFFSTRAAKEVLKVPR
jgi:uncharacterized protein